MSDHQYSFSKQNSMKNYFIQNKNEKDYSKYSGA